MRHDMKAPRVTPGRPSLRLGYAKVHHQVLGAHTASYGSSDFEQARNSLIDLSDWVRRLQATTIIHGYTGVTAIGKVLFTRFSIFGVSLYTTSTFQLYLWRGVLYLLGHRHQYPVSIKLSGPWPLLPAYTYSFFDLGVYIGIRTFSHARLPSDERVCCGSACLQKIV